MSMPFPKQLWEENDIKSYMEQISLHLGLSPVNIDYIRDRMERKERNPDGKYDFGNREIRTQETVEVVNGEHQIFEHIEDAQVEHHHDKDDPL
jgi:DNA-directed RNA polymerase alpha subunit